MTQVNVGEMKELNQLYGDLKGKLQKAGIFADMKRLRHFETPIEKLKRKAIARRRKKRFN